MTDLENLVESCITAESKAYIHESVICYRNGAFRASIVATWVAIVFDLISKIKELAATGDAKAALLNQKFETYLRQIEAGSEQGISKSLEFERNLLTAAKDDLQFIDYQQFSDLSRLREDRHRCAHPSFHISKIPYSPSSELARLHIRNAVTYILSQPAKQGKAAISELEAIISGQYFPKNTDQARKELEKSPLYRPTEALLNAFVDKIIFDFCTRGTTLFGKLESIFALKAANEMHRAVCEPRISKQIATAIRNAAPPEFMYAAYVAFNFSEAIPDSDHPTLDRLKTFISTGPYSEVGPLLRFAVESDRYLECVSTRLEQLTEDELEKSINTYRIGALAIKPALTHLKKSGSWSSANSRFDKLIKPIEDHIGVEEFVSIVKLSDEGADILGSSGLEELLRKKLASDSEFKNKAVAKLNEIGSVRLANYINERT